MLMSNYLGIPIVKIAFYSHFSTLKLEDSGQNPGGLRVLKTANFKTANCKDSQMIAKECEEKCFVNSWRFTIYLLDGGLVW